MQSKSWLYVRVGSLLCQKPYGMNSLTKKYHFLSEVYGFVWDIRIFMKPIYILIIQYLKVWQIKLFLHFFFSFAANTLVPLWLGRDKVKLLSNWLRPRCVGCVCQWPAVLLSRRAQVSYRRFVRKSKAFEKYTLKVGKSLWKSINFFYRFISPLANLSIRVTDSS